jgi:phosphoglycolate phosphatase
MVPTVLLFDIDGTLVDTGGAGRRAIDRAFEARFGRRDACSGFSFAGMTDLAILRAGLVAIGERPEEGRMAELLVSYLIALEEEMAEPTGYRVHAGVFAVLDAIGGKAGFAVGLGTGNVRDGARLKLTPGGLHDRFAFGGFGCDHEDRAELLRVGAALEEARVVVIGDTPRDVAAAKAIGAESVAVATGSFRAEELAACSATWVVPDLEAPGALGAITGG